MSSFCKWVVSIALIEIILIHSIFAQNNVGMAQEATRIEQKELVSNIMSQVRRRLSPDINLIKIQTIVYTGRLDIKDPSTIGLFKLFVKRPSAYRLVWQTNLEKKVVVANSQQAFGYEVFFKDHKNNNLQILSEDKKRFLNIEAHENLFAFGQDPDLPADLYYYGLQPLLKTSVASTFTVNATPQQKLDLENVMVHHVMIQYGNGVQYDKFIDWQTFEVLASKGPSNIVTRELGKQQVNGVFFPQSIEFYQNGQLVRVLTIDKIEVNVEIPDELFELPNQNPKK